MFEFHCESIGDMSVGKCSREQGIGVVWAGINGNKAFQEVLQSQCHMSPQAASKIPLVLETWTSRNATLPAKSFAYDGDIHPNEILAGLHDLENENCSLNQRANPLRVALVLLI